MKFSISNFVLAALLAVPAFASKVVEDSQNRFVMDDEVANTAVLDCDGSKGGFFRPENATYFDGNGVPFRTYSIALPTKELPQVFISDERLLELGKPVCADPERMEPVSFGFGPIQMSEAVQRDGLWLTDIRVPLYVKRGNSVALRKNFRLNVKFNGRAAGVKPGLRGLARALNVNGASRFGANQKALQKSLRKSASSDYSDVEFLAQFFVGDKKLGSFSEDGLYAVEYRSVRAAMVSAQREDDLVGIPVDKICLYGSSQDTLAAIGPGAAERNPNQIFEIPIEVRDHSPSSSKADGTFGEGDSIVFVGYGNGFWKRCDRENPSFKNGEMDYFHSYSPYSFDQGFLLGKKYTGKGKRLSDLVESPAGKGRDVEWMRYVHAEEDALLRDTYYGKDLNWESASGKEWFWHWHSRFDSTRISAAELKTDETYTLPGLVEGGRQYVAVTYMPRRSVSHSSAEKANDQKKDIYMSSRSYAERMDSIFFAVEVNGTRVRREATTLMPGGNFRIDGVELKKTGNSIALDMLPGGTQYDRFNGYSFAYQWKPVVDSAEWLLPGNVSGVINVPVPSGTQVMKFKNLQPVGYLRSSNGVAKDSVASEDDVRYLAVRSDAFREDLRVAGFSRPNSGVLKDLTRPNSKLEYLIIAPPDFINEAVALAEFRAGGSAVSSIATSVVNLEDIYRTYTAGRLSPVAIRNYLSYVYSVCPDFRYVLLVGSGTFDYRGMNSRLTPNHFPTYQDEDYVSEDFYGVLDSGEVIRFGPYELDVAVGRIPAQSPSAFANYVRKAKDHEMLKTFDNSSWRSVILLAADDAWNNGGVDNIPHTTFQENTAKTISDRSEEKNIRWDMKKIYLVDYERDASGQKKLAAENFISILNQGALITTYYGHGSKTDWAVEGLMKPSYVKKLSNKGRYTILASFSCTVGRFDEGAVPSLSEEMLMANGAGSIVSIGATRETFASENKTFGLNFMSFALTSDSVRRIGDAYVGSKRYSTLSGNQRYNEGRYVLLGEPVIGLPISEYKVKLDKPLEQIKALDKLTLSGTVDGLDDGYIVLNLKEGRSYKTVDLQNSMNEELEVFLNGPLIYSEEVAVKNGRFSTEFVTPRKMSFGDSLAEFTTWAYSKKSAAVGRSLIGHLRIAGISNYADSLKDTVPPTIKIQSCISGAMATYFVDGQNIKLQAPACLQVEVEDSTALDFREQADEGISFEVEGVQDPFHPSPYLEQNSKYAKVRMNFSTEQYPAGSYLFKVRALDVVGNAATKTLVVEITDEMETGLADVFNAPNPMGKKGTTFYFKNFADSRVNIFIYNQNGRLVKVLKDAVSGVTRWDGRDDRNRLLANGLYHYVVRCEVPASEGVKKKTWTKKQKLLISR